jgi:hypothetical protein
MHISIVFCDPFRICLSDIFVPIFTPYEKFFTTIVTYVNLFAGNPERFAKVIAVTRTTPRNTIIAIITAIEFNCVFCFNLFTAMCAVIISTASATTDIICASMTLSAFRTNRFSANSNRVGVLASL